MSDFESILAKARKLAALADPANGGSEGERENAQRMLARQSVKGTAWQRPAAKLEQEGFLLR